MTRRAAAALLALAGCTSIAPPPPLAGSEWRVVAINGRTTPETGPYRMRFERDRLSGQFGCNHFGGEYRLERGVLTTRAVTMTEMACSEPAAGFESTGVRNLALPLRVVWQDSTRVTLSNDFGNIALKR